MASDCPYDNLHGDNDLGFNSIRKVLDRDHQHGGQFSGQANTGFRNADPWFP